MKLSLCIASIRTPNLLKLYESAKKSCTEYSWEMIIVSPFDIPQELKDCYNVKFVRDYGCPTKVSQLSTTLASGEYFHFGVDDAIYLSKSLDNVIKLLEGKLKKDAVVTRYYEGSGFLDNPDTAKAFPDSYWFANHHLSVPGWLPHWKIAPQFAMRLDYYKELGGFDCDYSCCSFSTWDLCGRIQKDSGVFHISTDHVMLANNFGEIGLDHAPVYHAHGPDHERFIKMSSEQPNRIKIDFDNWKQSPVVWERRFGKKKYETYEEMINGHNTN